MLLLPVGGTYTIDAVAAKEYADKIGAKIVVPMHFKPIDGALDIAPISAYLALCDETTVESADGEIEVTKEELATAPTRVVCLERVK